MTALVLSLFNSAAVTALWVFYLAKHFSTHKVQLLDLNKTAKHKIPVGEAVPLRKPTRAAPLVDEDGDEIPEDEEQAAADFADRAVAKMFNRTKENLNDSLR